MVKHDVQLVAPVDAEYVSAPQTGQVLPDLYAPALHVPTVHKPVTVLFELLHVCVPHVFRFVMLVQVVAHAVFAVAL